MRRGDRLSGALMELCDAHRPLPPLVLETRGIWVDLPCCLRDEVASQSGSLARGALHALEHALLTLAPLVVSCDPADLGCQCTRRPGDTHAERILLFERRAGGIGIAEPLLDGIAPLLQVRRPRGRLLRGAAGWHHSGSVAAQCLPQWLPQWLPVQCLPARRVRGRA